jgi:hypothetical protein
MDCMKRKVKDLEILMDSMNLNKKPKIYHIIKKEVHNDTFEIGKLREDKEFYTKEEVIKLLNNRESILYKKFYNFIRKRIMYNSCESFIPTWVK